jgi:hypothetical protein
VANQQLPRVPGVVEADNTIVGAGTVELGHATEGAEGALDVQVWNVGTPGTYALVPSCQVPGGGAGQPWVNVRTVNLADGTTIAAGTGISAPGLYRIESRGNLARLTVTGATLSATNAVRIAVNAVQL